MTDLNVARTAYVTAQSMNASPKVMLALFEAGVVESNFTNVLVATDHDSLGFLQQRPSQGWPNPTDVPTATRSFVSRAIPIQNNYGTSGMLAQAVQRSAFPLKYDAAQLQAQQILNQVSNGAGSILPSNSGVVTVANPLDSLSNLIHLMKDLISPSWWGRVLFGLMGAIVIAFALWKMSGSPGGSFVKGAGGMVGKAITE
jgi:hypothetical protein